MTASPAAGGRATRQGAALSVVLAETTEFRSAQELHAELRRRGAGVGLTTVYRHLQGLADAGTLDVVRGDGGETLYRRCGTDGHHHHLVCRRCGRAVEVAGREVERWTERVAREAGFRDVAHTVEVFGVCGECAAD